MAGKHKHAILETKADFSNLPNCKARIQEDRPTALSPFENLTIDQANALHELDACINRDDTIRSTMTMLEHDPEQTGHKHRLERFEQGKEKAKQASKTKLRQPAASPSTGAQGVADRSFGFKASTRWWTRRTLSPQMAQSDSPWFIFEVSSTHPWHTDIAYLNIAGTF
jgi:hypothetical protein